MKQRGFLQGAVYAFLLKHGGCTTEDVTNGMGLPVGSAGHWHGVAYSMLYRLQKQGAVVLDNGLWRAVPGVEVVDRRALHSGRKPGEKREWKGHDKPIEFYGAGKIALELHWPHPRPIQKHPLEQCWGWGV